VRALPLSERRPRADRERLPPLLTLPRLAGWPESVGDHDPLRLVALGCSLGAHDSLATIPLAIFCGEAAERAQSSGVHHLVVTATGPSSA